jgi:hypothetical protein
MIRGVKTMVLISLCLFLIFSITDDPQLDERQAAHAQREASLAKRSLPTSVPACLPQNADESGIH